MFAIANDASPTLQEPSKWYACVLVLESLKVTGRRSPELNSFIAACLVKEPTKRASAQELLEVWLFRPSIRVLQCAHLRQHPVFAQAMSPADIAKSIRTNTLTAPTNVVSNVLMQLLETGSRDDQHNVLLTYRSFVTREELFHLWSHKYLSHSLAKLSSFLV